MLNGLLDKEYEELIEKKCTGANKKLALVVAHLEKQIICNKFSLKVGYGSCKYAQPTSIFRTLAVMVTDLQKEGNEKQ